jgi:glutamate/tyrosine decarboxylase-like PLP-dependent enzyme
MIKTMTRTEQTLDEQTARLEERQAPLDLSAEEFAEIGHRLIDDIALLLAGMRNRPLTSGETPEEIRELLGATAPLPEHGAPASEVVREATDLLVDHSLYNSHPRFFGYITAPAAPIGILGDLLAAAINPNGGAWKLSPMASEMEDQAIRWIGDLVGFPAGGDGVLTSGGNVANMLGFYAARAAKAGWDVRRSGTADPAARPLRVYGSKGTHTWIQKAADLSGVGAESIRWVDTDDDDRMRMDRLREMIEADLAEGDRPFLVVGTGGSVSTGAVDPLTEIREICDEFDMWMHIDGAYGAFGAAASSAPAELRALGLADSVALDPHKWLYSPLEVGCALVRDPSALLAAFSYRPKYYSFEEEAKNFFERGIQNSRGFRALKVWLQLKQVGREGYVTMIEDDIELARRFHDITRERPLLEAFGHGLSISTYRFVPADLSDRSTEPEVAAYLNELNQEIQARMDVGGEAFVSNAVLGDVYALRMCVVNFRTTLGDVRRLADISESLGLETDAELRPEELR